jgi:hypothetical protein
MSRSDNAAGTREAAGARISVVVAYIVWVGLPIHSALIPFFALMGVGALALFNVGSVATWLAIWASSRNGYHGVAWLLVVLEVVAHAVAAVTLLGLGSGFQYYLISIIPLIVFNEQISVRACVAGALSVIGVFIALQFTAAGVALPASFDAVAGPALAGNVFMALGAAVVACVYFRIASIEVERQVEDLALSLERRVAEQVAEIVERAEQIEALNAQLQGQVKARSDELATALARLSERREQGGLAKGSVLDERFEIEAPIGAGGMGLVYAGNDRKSGQRVAIKVVRAATGGDVDTLQRFVREAGTAATVPHPAVVKMLHVGVAEGGLVYQVQELVEGVELSHCLVRPWAPADAARLGAVLFDALAAAHARGVVHRDVKANNLMLTKAAPGLKLLDFGIAKLFEEAQGTGVSSMTRTGLMIGTPAFMAPEQARGASNVGDRADVYSAGTVLYMMLAGRLPFQSTPDGGVNLQRLIEDAPELRSLAPSTPEALARIVMRCLSRDPNERPSAQALAAELAAFADAHGGRALEALCAEFATLERRGAQPIGPRGASNSSEHDLETHTILPTPSA